MKTIIDIDEEVLQQVMKASGSKTKKGAIVAALNEYLRLKKREELKGLIGGYEEFDLSLEEVRKMRHER